MPRIKCFMFDDVVNRFKRRSFLQRRTSTLSSKFFQIIDVPNRSFVEVKGVDTSKFLQGLCTSDVTTVSTNEGQPTTFLNSKGRVLADGFMYKLHQSDDIPAVILELDRRKVDEMFQYLNMYRLRSKVTITKRNLGLRLMDQENVVNGDGEGALIVVNDNRAPTLLHHRSVRVSPASAPPPADDKKYKLYRYLHGLPEGEEIEGAVPFDGNLDLLHYINFSKGCYVGQELMARTKYKGVVRKRMVPFFVSRRHAQAFERHSSSINKPRIGSSSPTTEITRVSFAGSAFSLLSKDTVDSIISVCMASSSFTTSVDSGSSPDKGKVFVSATESDNNDDHSVGDVIAYDEALGLGLVLLKLEVLSAPGVISGEQRILAQLRDANRDTIVTFRPSWWPDLDPVTGQHIFAS